MLPLTKALEHERCATWLTLGMCTKTSQWINTLDSTLTLKWGFTTEYMDKWRRSHNCGSYYI